MIGRLRRRELVRKMSKTPGGEPPQALIIYSRQNLLRKQQHLRVFDASVNESFPSSKQPRFFHVLIEAVEFNLIT